MELCDIFIYVYLHIDRHFEMVGLIETESSLEQLDTVYSTNSIKFLVTIRYRAWCAYG